MSGRNLVVRFQNNGFAWSHMLRMFLRIGVLALTIVGASIAQQREIVEIPNFPAYRARQQTPMWCWAGVLEMLLGWKGLKIDQSLIAGLVKGRIGVEPASYIDMTRFLQGQWSVGNPPQGWGIDTFVGQGPPPPQMLWGTLGGSTLPMPENLRDRRPIILLYGTGGQVGHFVIMYGGDFNIAPFNVTVNSIKIVDPWTGAPRTEPGMFLAQTWFYWLTNVHTPRERRF